MLLFLPGWIVFVVYIPSLLNGFVWDDTYFLSDQPFLRSPELWPQHILAPLFVSQNYFRPLPLLTFVIEGRLGEVDPLVFHLSNVLIHALNTCVIAVLARRLVEAAARHGARGAGNELLGPWIAAAAALLFGLHPALIESVCWISDRFDLMMTAFLLLALWADAAVRGRRAAPLMGLLFLLALLCKETSVLLLAVLPLWQLAQDSLAPGAPGAPGAPQGWRALSPAALRSHFFTRRRLAIYVSLGVALVIYMLIRHAALGTFYRSDTQIVPGSALQHALLMGKTLGWYLVLMVWPFGLIGPVHPAVTPVPLDDPWAWLGVAAVVLAAYALLRLVRRLPRSGWLAAAGLAALLPVSNAVPLTIGDNMVHDRYLIFPVAMAALAIAAWLGGLEGRARQPVFLNRLPRLSMPAAALSAWLVASVCVIAVTMPRWESNISLWSWAYAREPLSRIAQSNYMNAAANVGLDDQAIEVGRIMLARDPDHGGILQNMGFALMHKGRYQEAKTYTLRALDAFAREDSTGQKERADVGDAWNLLGYLHMQLGEWDAAQRALQSAVDIAPYLTRPHYNLAMLAYQRGDVATARREMATALRYDSPDLAALHRRLAAEKEKELGLTAPAGEPAP